MSGWVGNVERRVSPEGRGLWGLYLLARLEGVADWPRVIGRSRMHLASCPGGAGSVHGQPRLQIFISVHSHR